jgi:hypothetical protein
MIRLKITKNDMNTEIKMLEKIYEHAHEVASANKQVIKENKNEYYITLEQLNEVLMQFYL